MSAFPRVKCVTCVTFVSVRLRCVPFPHVDRHVSDHLHCVCVCVYVCVCIAVAAVGGSLDLSQIAGRASSVEPVSGRGSKVQSVCCACVPICVPVCVTLLVPICFPIYVFVCTVVHLVCV